MESLESDLENHFCSSVLATAYRLQSSSSAPSPLSMTPFSANRFGQEFLQCIEGLPASRVILPLFQNFVYI